MKKYLNTNLGGDGLYYLLLFIALIPLFIFRDYTLDNELRYISIADEALRNGDIFTFYNHGVAYADKPPLYLWLVMAGRALFGEYCMAFLGLFSIIPALVILRIMNQWVKPYVTDGAARWAGALMLYTSVYFIGSAVVIRMDMLMCMFIVMALHTFWRIYSGESEQSGHVCRDKILFPIWVFMAVFSKGPVGILVPLVTVILFLILKRDWRKIATYWGWRTWSILLVLCGLWFGAVYIEGGIPYLDNLLIKQTAGRAVDAFHHKAPVWYYAISIWYSLAPWSMLVLALLGWGLYNWRRMVTTDLERLFIVSALSTFAVLSMVSGKIQIYLLPAFPFFIYIAVLWIAKVGTRRWMSWLVGIPALALVVAFPGLFVAAPYVSDFPIMDSLLVPIGAAVASLGGVGCIVWLAKGRLNRAIMTLAAGLLATVFTVSFAIPQLNSHLGMGGVCETAKRVAEENGIDKYYTYGIGRAENIDVYLGTSIRKLEAAELNSIQKGVLITLIKQIDTDTALTVLFAGQEIHRIGDYAFCVVDKQKEKQAK